MESSIERSPWEVPEISIEGDRVIRRIVRPPHEVVEMPQVEVELPPAYNWDELDEIDLNEPENEHEPDRAEEDPNNNTTVEALVESRTSYFEQFWRILCGENECPIWTKVFYWGLLVASALETLRAVKAELLHWNSEEPLVSYAAIVYNVDALLLRTYFIFLVCVMSTKITSLRQAFDNCKIDLCNFPENVKSKIIIWIASSALLGISTSYCISGTLSGWTAEDVLLQQSGTFAEALFGWTFNEEKIFVLYSNYSATISVKTVLLGLTSFFCSSGTNTLNLIILDTVLVTAISLQQKIKGFKKQLDFFEEKDPDNLTETKAVVRTYKKLRKVSDEIENCLGLVLDLLLLFHIFFGGYFLALHVYLRTFRKMMAVRLLAIAKILGFYIIAARVSQINSRFKLWVLKEISGTKSTIEVDGESLTQTALLEEINSFPIGIGNISKSFLWKFGSLLVSFSLFLLEHVGKLISQ